MEGENTDMDLDGDERHKRKACKVRKAKYDIRIAIYAFGITWHWRFWAHCRMRMQAQQTVSDWVVSRFELVRFTVILKWRKGDQAASYPTSPVLPQNRSYYPNWSGAYLSRLNGLKRRLIVMPLKYHWSHVKVAFTLPTEKFMVFRCSRCGLSRALPRDEAVFTLVSWKRDVWVRTIE